MIPARHRLASRRTLRLKEIEADPFLLLKTGHCLRETTIVACRRADLRPNVVFEGGQFDTLLALVAVGLGVIVAPQMAVARYKRNGHGCRFIPLDDELAFRKIGVVRLKHRYPTLAQRTLIEHLKNC